MHSSGSITRKFGPSWKQSTGQTSTHSVYLHLMQFSVTTKGMDGTLVRWRGHFNGLGVGLPLLPVGAASAASFSIVTGRHSERAAEVAPAKADGVGREWRSL